MNDSGVTPTHHVDARRGVGRPAVCRMPPRHRIRTEAPVVSGDAERKRALY
jgi:hypothetical protein